MPCRRQKKACAAPAAGRDHSLETHDSSAAIAPARHPFLFRVRMGSKEKSEGQVSYDPNRLLVRQQGILPDGVSSKQVRSDADLFEMKRNRKCNCAPPLSPCLLSVDPAGPSPLVVRTQEIFLVRAPRSPQGPRQFNAGRFPHTRPELEGRIRLSAPRILSSQEERDLDVSSNRITVEY